MRVATRGLARPALGGLLMLLAIVPARTQGPEPFRVQVHVGGDPALREPAATAITSAVRSIRDVQIVERDGEYLVSAIALPTNTNSVVISMAVMNVHTEASLANLASLWGLQTQTRDRMRAVFRGTGALVDQRVLTGPDVAALAGDIARALDADTLRRARSAR